MDIKKNVIGGVTAMLMLGAGLTVLAENTASPMPVPVRMDQKMMVEIGPVGRALLRGTVSVVGTNSLTVKSWGGNWMVNILSSAKLMPGSDMSQFHVGDFVGAQGMASQTAAWTIDATLVRNWTERKEIKVERKENKEEIRAMIKSTMPRNWEGVASNVNVDAKTFTLTADNTAYSVMVLAGAKIVNEKYVAIDFSMVKNGDKVRVYGPSTSGTISASVVRDTSIKTTPVTGGRVFPDIVTCCTESHSCTRVDRPQCTSAGGTVNAANSCSPNPC